ncbi:MAG: hypothetical protein ACK55I_21845, partial [bacterium]
YGSDIKKFLREFSIAPSDVETMKTLAKAKNVEWKDNEFTQDADYIKLIVKAYVGRSVFNNNGYTAVMLGKDKQVTKALSLFPEAARISKLR